MMPGCDANSDARSGKTAATCLVRVRVALGLGLGKTAATCLVRVRVGVRFGEDGRDVPG